jgi:uncharacterized coiled-coil protein SlyX
MRLFVLVLFCGFGCTGPSAQEAEVARLNARVRSLEERLAQVEAKLETMEARAKDAQGKAVKSQSETTSPVPQQINTVPQTNSTLDQEIRNRDVLSNNLIAAPRIDNIPLYSSSEGFLVLDGRTRVQLGGSAKVDLIHDFQPAGFPTAFIPSTIPVGVVAYGNTNLNINESRFSLDIRRDTDLGELRFYYENDFFGGDGVQPVFHLYHLYGQLHNFLMGYTYSNFLDVDSDPDTLDFQGPNGNTDATQAQVRYTQPLGGGNSLAVSAEEPLTDIPAGSSNVSATSSVPDFAVKYRFDAEQGHLQVSSVFRDLRAYSPTLGEAHVFGWGVTLAGAHSVGSRDSALFQVNYGEGIGRYLIDLNGQGSDAALNSQGKLQALPAFGGYVAYQHYWSRRWRSTATYGYVRVQNLSTQSPVAFHSSQYAAANVIWKIRDTISLGGEFLYGTHVQNDRANAEATRFQFSIQYDLFPPLR